MRPGIKDTRRMIFNELVDGLVDEYDMDNYRVREWIKTKPGMEQFIKYLSNRGISAKFYAWPNEEKPMSAGIEFDDDNPILIALRLKHMKDPE